MALPLLTCPRCSRANPLVALFCHYDGIALAPPPDRRPPLLRVEPTNVQLGPLAHGEGARFHLHLFNAGEGIVHGKALCDSEPWLTLNESGPALHVHHFEFGRELDLPVYVRAAALQANNQPYTARLRFESTGGAAEVTFVVTVPVTPFPDGVLAGFKSRRRLIEKALGNRRAAAELFASGAVARWYEANGWVYPCRGPLASGRAALQQFLEALNPDEAPHVVISSEDLFLKGHVGEELRAEVWVNTRERKHVYIHAVSDQPWVEIEQVTTRGPAATMRLRIPAVPARPGETLRGSVQVLANGGRRFTVAVHLRVLGDGAGSQDGNWRDSPPPVRRRAP